MSELSKSSESGSMGNKTMGNAGQGEILLKKIAEAGKKKLTNEKMRTILITNLGE